jgi:hypothetical protein
VQSGGNSGPVYGYTALSNGQFTTISGSPFKPGTKIVGGTGSKFFTVGKTLLHSYAVGSNGALGSQLSQIGLFNYAGGSCGNTADPVGPRPYSTTLERASMCCCKAEAVRRVLPTRPTT